MLSVAEERIDDVLDVPTSQYLLESRSPSRVLSSNPVEATGRFGEGRRPNLPVILAIVLIHAMLIYALIQVRQHVIEAREAKLTVVNLTPPPPPPAADTPPPPPSKPEIVAPPPLVQMPVPPVQLVATTPDPVPVLSPMPVMSPPGPSASAAPPAPPSIVQGGDLGAQMVAGKPPRYPIESRRKREQGTVVLSLTLGVDGSVESIVIAQSSGSKRLDDAARDAVRGWRWKPIIRNGQPARVKGVVEIPFVLRIDAA